MQALQVILGSKSALLEVNIMTLDSLIGRLQKLRDRKVELSSEFQKKLDDFIAWLINTKEYNNYYKKNDAYFKEIEKLRNDQDIQELAKEMGDKGCS